MTVLARWRIRLAIRRALLASAERKLTYRQRKHSFYHNQSKRPADERKRLATKWHKLVNEAQALVAKRKSQVAYAERVVARHQNAWGGAREVTEEVIQIVGGRAPVTSRKRTETYGNPSSDHHVGNKTADAVDFGVTDAHWLKNEISRKLGGPRTLPDYGSFNVRRGGRTFRVQMIAGTHGTGPHLHVGVKRV